MALALTCKGWYAIKLTNRIGILYLNILKLRDKQVFSIKPKFPDLLKAEIIKSKYNKKKIQPILLTHQLNIAVRELLNHPNITIKKQIKQIFL